MDSSRTLHQCTWGVLECADSSSRRFAGAILHCRHCLSCCSEHSTWAGADSLGSSFTLCQRTLQPFRSKTSAFLYRATGHVLECVRSKRIKLETAYEFRTQQVCPKPVCVRCCARPVSACSRCSRLVRWRKLLCACRLLPIGGLLSPNEAPEEESSAPSSAESRFWESRSVSAGTQLMPQSFWTTLTFAWS